MDAKELKGMFQFLHEAEKLKTLLRHSWLSSGRRESVAEHSWRMALMAIVINPYLDKPTDLSKVLKMVLIHDLGEIHYKDNWAFNKVPEDKAEQEKRSLKKLLRNLPAKQQGEIESLWKEFESAKTPEARFAKFLDKNEVLLQHDEADIKHLHKKGIPFNLYYGKEWGEHDKFLKAFREAINQETLVLYRKNKIPKELYSDWI